jgi:type IV pilus assembly protein PilW
MNKRKLQKGVSLIELMLAVAISSILLLGVGLVYKNSKRGYNIQEEFSALQENARIAMNFLVKDIRLAGFIGCAWNNNLDYEDFLQPVAGAGNDSFLTSFRVGLEGFEADNTGPGNTVDLATYAGAWDRALPAAVAAQGPIPGSDVLIVRRARGSGIKLTNNKESANFRISDEGTNIGTGNCHGPTELCEGDILLVTDCSKSRLFQASDIQDSTDELLIVHQAAGNPGNNPGDVSWGGASTDPENHYEEGDAELFKASAFAYYIDTGAGGEPALFRISAAPGSLPEELIEGVENMQVLYGIDTDKTSATDTSFDGVANQYVTADAVNFNNDNVVSARISLLMRSSAVKETAVTPANPLKLVGTTAASSTRVTTSVADRSVRKVFTVTVKVRNKGLI